MNMEENSRPNAEIYAALNFQTSAINKPQKKELHEQQLSACHNICTLHENTVFRSSVTVNTIYVIYNIFWRDKTSCTARS